MKTSFLFMTCCLFILLLSSFTSNMAHSLLTWHIICQQLHKVQTLQFLSTNESPITYIIDVPPDQ